MAEVESKVKKIVAEQMSVSEEEISKQTSFVNDLNADSLDSVELIMEFEDEFDISIPDEEAEKIQTVGQAVDYITAHLNKNG
ncbi:MAG: acyl carrier protein [Phycisphaerae bacterium]|nr:acyl carrier protein [Phycisphaerae bacterium]